MTSQSSEKTESPIFLAWRDDRYACHHSNSNVLYAIIAIGH